MTMSGARVGDDPAEVWAWAREHGVAVGSRGRMPTEVLAAYRDAQRPPTAPQV